MDNGYYQPLKLDFVLGTEHFEYVKANLLTDPLKKQTIMFGIDAVGDDIQQFAASCNCVAMQVNYFYTPAGESRVIHSDNTRRDNCTKINFVYNGAGSVMKWFKLKNEQVEPNVGVTPSGNKYNYYQEAQCDLVASTELIGPTMVNAGALHSVENHTNTNRWAISFLLGDENKKILQWNDAVERFKNYFYIPT
jgi:hypothetical protein